MSYDTDVRSGRAAAPTAARSSKPEELSAHPAFGWSGAAWMGAGGLLTGCLVVAGLAAGASAGGDPALEPIGKGELAVASQSLLPAQAAALVAEAESCRAPLAVLTVRGTGRGTVRIRSGSYESPTIQLGQRPDRLAVPYPAPYRTGRGQLVVDSAAVGIDIFLSPGIHIDAGKRSTRIDVRWNPRQPC